uniref:primosomal protein N' family DNA-binding protein n=1 Tax=Leuconostoc pseudomesenteroides TaxID=33968 RepID=UPI002897E0C9
MKKQYAQIIVDVPTMQTDQPYTYVIPEEMIDQILPGMRVTVPFGRRKVMGFVIGIRATTDLSEDQLRPLTTILDLSPVLNTELLSLSDYLADETFAFRISILQTMLPNALKADYQHFIKIVGKVSDDVANRLFMGLTEIAFHANQYSDKDLATLAKLRRQHSIEVRIEVNDRAKVKTQLAYQFSQNVTMLKTAQQSLRPTAKKQAQLMAFILQHVGETWLKKELQEMLPVSDATLAHAVIHEWLVKKHVEALRDPFKATVQKSNPLDLNDEQQQAFDRISASADLHRFAPFLLEGITGSGKTEVYLQVAQHVLKQGKTVLFLVPEIALTPQMVRRVKSRFGEQTAVLHSGLSDGERYDEWRRIERGDVQIVVGARSAVFAPLDNLGLIIVDEEHETTYKQSDNPRYNA